MERITRFDGDGKNGGNVKEAVFDEDRWLQLISGEVIFYFKKSEGELTIEISTIELDKFKLITNQFAK
jgi:hypothetical protein